MTDIEYRGSIHLHTTASDGTGSFEEVVAAGRAAGLDFVIPTDHNVLITGKDGWYGSVLLLVGEEIHDTERVPEANHYLAFDIRQDVALYAPDPQAVVDAVNAQGGFGFIAHPFESAAPIFGEGELSWVNWEVSGYTGLSIWNWMSELKDHVPNKAQALLLAYWPTLFIRGPRADTLTKWDELSAGRRVVAICASDAHAATYHLGPLTRQVFPYEYLFRVSRTHILVPEPFTGELNHDRQAVYDALRQGHCFTAYDGLAEATGFRFRATSGGAVVVMGDELTLDGEANIEVISPCRADLRLLRDGEEIARVQGRRLSITVHKPGVYRVEARRRKWLKPRGWVFTNPIYLR